MSRRLNCSPWLKGVHRFKSGGRDLPACRSNRRQWDPLDHLDSQKPVVPSCLAKEILEKRFEVEQPANISQKRKKKICPPSAPLLIYMTRRQWSLLSLLEH